MNTQARPADLKSLVAGDKTASFVRFRRGQLWYVTQCGFEFPVPVEDVGDATFGATERAMLMMRYIRKHLAAIEAGRQESASQAQPTAELDCRPRC